jgi:hypothetical protein
MVTRRRRVENEGIVPSDGAALLLKACPDLEEWPMRWRYDSADLAPGAALLEEFKPFLLDMLHSELAKKTFNRHRDNLWLVGGEMIRRRRDDPKIERLPIAELVRLMIEEEGGPLISSGSSESLQDEVDATCRKFYRFLNPK